MSIVISIVKIPDSASDTKTSHTFTNQGGTIGRGDDNLWILQDPDRYISSRHSEISFENGQYYLTDLSTNGTFSNGASVPIGKGNTVKLKDGDKFTLGDYEFLVSAWQEERVNSSAEFAPAPFTESQSFDDPFASPQDQDFFSSATPFGNDGFGDPFGAHVSSAEPLFSPEHEETDPLAFFDKSSNDLASNSYTNQAFNQATHSDRADVMNQSIIWPESRPEIQATSQPASGAIPDDWDAEIGLEPGGAPSVINNAAAMSSQPEKIQPQAEKSAAEITNEKILAELALLKQQAREQAQTKDAATKSEPVTKNSRRSVTGNEKTLIEALGLASQNLSDEKILEITQVVGELVRETVTGMMQVLSSRSSIKNEFRMNVTTIQPVENNPLKFSANVDDAMDNMFIKDGNSYKKPVDAIKEGFEGIAEHQIAILAGIRTAFKGVIERFNPVELEKRFEKYNKSGLIPGMTKAKNWESYTHYYHDLVDDMDNSFQHLFGYEFVQAYEEQLQKLAIARKTKNIH